jgi:hypothetical protein
MRAANFATLQVRGKLDVPRAGAGRFAGRLAALRAFQRGPCLLVRGGSFEIAECSARVLAAPVSQVFTSSGDRDGSFPPRPSLFGPRGLILPLLVRTILLSFCGHAPASCSPNASSRLPSSAIGQPSVSAGPLTRGRGSGRAAEVSTRVRAFAAGGGAGLRADPRELSAQGIVRLVLCEPRRKGQ